MSTPTAEQFTARLEALRSEEERLKLQRYFKTGAGEYGEGDIFIGVRMGQLFELAKEFLNMPVGELEKLLDSPIHEFRAGAVSIMDKACRAKKTSEARRSEFYELYLRRSDRINNWDLVDLGAPYVVGRFLENKSRDVLYELARSEDIWERRIALLATTYFVRQGETKDAFAIAELLVNDSEDLIQKSVGGVVRWAGLKNEGELWAFLDKYAATMPRTALRYALERVDPKTREKYMNLKPSDNVKI